jgi:hypothetical protein
LNLTSILTPDLTIGGGAIFLASAEPFSPLRIFIVLTAFFLLMIFYQYRVRAQRRCFIQEYRWPPGLIRHLEREHPTLTRSQVDEIERGLRQFFIAYLMGGCRYVSMPSVAADALWHHFILYTREYDAFCRQAFGQFLHHRPAEVLSPGQKQSNEGLRRVWWQACKAEKLDPRSTTTLPLLFALDASLKFPGGHVYHPNCEALRRQGIYGGQCGGDFVSLHFDGTTDGFGDGDGGGGDGDGGGGCGGD